jgi:hypothetical protein
MIAVVISGDDRNLNFQRNLNGVGLLNSKINSLSIILCIFATNNSFDSSCFCLACVCHLLRMLHIFVPHLVLGCMLYLDGRFLFLNFCCSVVDLFLFLGNRFKRNSGAGAYKVLKDIVLRIVDLVFIKFKLWARGIEIHIILDRNPKSF